MTNSRREFLVGTAATISLATIGSTFRLAANPLGLPIGVQLYVVGEQLAKDFERTLQEIAAIGYTEVETAGFFGHKPAEVKKAFDNAGLKCVSMHLSPDVNIEQLLQYGVVLNPKYVVISGLTPELMIKKLGSDKFDAGKFFGMLGALQKDDFTANAESCNRLGEQVKAAGHRLAYHNHNFEFKPYGKQTGFEILLSETDPALVSFELDCAWAAAAGQSVPEMLRADPDRYRLLHIKNFKKLEKPSYSLEDRPVFTRLRDGAIDYTKVFAATEKGEVEHYFVEHEPPYSTISAMEVLRSGYEYLHKMS